MMSQREKTHDGIDPPESHPNLRIVVATERTGTEIRANTVALRP